MRPANPFADTIARIPDTSPFDLDLDPLTFNPYLDQCACGVPLIWSRTLGTAIPDRDPSDGQINVGDAVALIRCEHGFGGVHLANTRDMEE